MVSIVRLAVMAAAASLLAPAARAVPLPSVSALVRAEATFEGVTQGPFIDSDPGTGGGPPFVEEMAFSFDAGAPDPFDNSALATAASFTDGSVHTRSRVDKESASLGPGNFNEAVAFATNATHYRVSSPSPQAVDLSIVLNIDGVLDVAGEAFVGSSALTSELLAQVEVSVLLFATNEATSLTLFHGSAILTSTPTAVGAPGIAFATTGAWASSWVAGPTGIDPSPGAFIVDGESRMIDASLGLVATLESPTTFALVIEIETTARGEGLWEAGFGSIADFFDTASLAVSAATPGATVESVPEPALPTLIGATLLLLRAGRRSMRPGSRSKASTRSTRVAA